MSCDLSRQILGWLIMAPRLIETPSTLSTDRLKGRP